MEELNANNCVVADNMISNFFSRLYLILRNICKAKVLDALCAM